MAGTTKDMSLIKQVLQLKQAGESNRGVSRKLPIDKETVNGYVNTVKANGWNISDLLEIDDPELERMFHAGSPAYTDRRMEEFLILLPRYRELLADSKSHVSRQVLFDEYRATHPDGYGKSQFYYHLKQNLVAKKDVTAVLANTYRPGEKLMVDFAGDKLSYVDAETGEVIKKGGGVCRLHALQRLYLCDMCTFAEDGRLPVCHKDVPGTSGRCTSHTDSRQSQIGCNQQ